MTEKKQQTAEERANELYFSQAKKRLAELFGDRDLWEISDEHGLTIDTTIFVKRVFETNDPAERAKKLYKIIADNADSIKENLQGFLFKAAWWSICGNDETSQKEFAQAVAEFSSTENFKKFVELFDIAPYFEGTEEEYQDSDPLTAMATDLAYYADLIQMDNLILHFDNIYPAAKKVVEERQAQTGKPVPLISFFRDIDEKDDVLIKSLYDLAVERCEPWYPVKTTEPKKISIEKIAALSLSIDPLTNSVLYDPEAANSGETVYLDVTRREDRGGRGYEPKAVISYRLETADIEELANTGIYFSQAIEPEDLVNAFAVADLLEKGQTELTLNQIHAAKGYTTTPSQKQKQNMRESFLRMSLTRMCYSNEKEVQAGYNYPKRNFTHTALFEYEEDFETTVNGNANTATIRPLRVPPIVQIARERGQIMTVPVALLQTKGVKSTPTSWRIRLYLLKRIRQAKNSRTASKKKAGAEETRATKILYKKIYEKAGIDGKDKRKQQLDARKTIAKILEQFKYEEEIVHFSIGKDGVTIYHTTGGV